MVHENYTYAFPLNQSYSLEVTLKVINKPAVTNEPTSRFLERIPDDIEGLSKFEITDLDKIREKIIRAQIRAYSALSPTNHCSLFLNSTLNVVSDP